MKIKSIKLRNLQSWVTADIEFPKPVTLLLAENNVGKTAFTRAIEIGIRGTQSSKAPTTEFIRDGAPFANIELEVGKVKIMRTVSPKGIATSVNGTPSNKNVFDFYAPPGLLEPAMAFSVLCSVGGFFGLDAANQRAVLEGLIDQTVPPELIEKLPTEGHCKPPTTLGEIDAAYAAVYARRTVAGQQLRALISVVKPEAADLGLVNQIRVKLEVLGAEERATLLEQGEKLAERKMLVASLETIKEKITRITLTRDEIATADKDQMEASRHMSEIDAQVQAATKDRERLIRLKTWRDGMKKLEGGSACVISEAVVCPLELKSKAGFIQSWDKVIAELEQKLGVLATAEEIATAQRVLAATVIRVRDVAELSKLKIDLATVENSIARCTVDTTTTDNLRARIKKGEENFATATKLAGQWVKFRTYETERDRLNKALADLEILCQQFGPKGIRATLLVGRLNFLETNLNDVLSRFNLKLTFGDDQWALKINGRRWEAASASELYRAGIALQVALASVSGVKLVVIDGADILDRTNKGALFGLLQQALEEGLVEQAIITATLNNPAALEASYPEWLQVLHVVTTPEGAQVK